MLGLSLRPNRFSIILVLVALAALLMTTATAGAKEPTPQRKSAQRDGARCKLVRKAGKPRAVRVCKRSAPASAKLTPSSGQAPSTDSVASAPSATAEAGPAPAATTTPPVVTTTPPVIATGEPEIQAAIGPGFNQNPLIPTRVTWRYSVAATRTVTTNGVPQTETLPTPDGILAFFVDGALECEIHALGAINESACTVDLPQLGGHEVKTIYSAAAGSPSSIVTRTDYVGRYPTATNPQVSVEPVPPEYLDIGPNSHGFTQYGYEIGRLRITGSTSPGGYPTFSCEGQPVACLIPGVSLKNNNGSASVPLYAQHRNNLATGQEEWHVGFRAYSPALREEDFFWKFPPEMVGTEFFHAVSEPSPTLYEPSSATVPLNLNGGHYPFYRTVKVGEGGGSIAAVEGTPRKVLTLGSYEKLGGPEFWLRFSGHFNNAPGEAEGCRYELRIDGQNRGESRKATSNLGFEFLNGYPGLAPGPHTFEVWVERNTGAGPGNCAIKSGYLEASEVLH